jgi:NFU1 iron-sulfur cluster scaffold homolog, mitochondrial
MKVSSVVTTPNPDALKFTLDQELLREGSRSFTSPNAAELDPLASLLFGLEGVTSVFYMMNFVTVNKKADLEWEPLEKGILEALRSFEPPEEVKEEKASVDSAQGDGTPYAEMSPAQKVLAIDQLLEREIRPGLAGDGGGLEIVGLEESVLQIHYEGACGSCPSSTSGTLMYIESILKANLDENLSVIPV